jgi:hypothetical protein
MAMDNITLCPVCAGTVIMRRNKSFAYATDNTLISALWRHNQTVHNSSTQIINALRDAVTSIREDMLHINKEAIGIHLICSGVVMAIFLGGCPVFLIMMIGHWSSNAFLPYIRKQVEEFDHDVLKKMIKHRFY